MRVDVQVPREPTSELTPEADCLVEPRGECAAWAATHRLDAELGVLSVVGEGSVPPYGLRIRLRQSASFALYSLAVSSIYRSMHSE